MIDTFPALYRQADSRALIANIWANPDDDVARLAFADWLDENADSDAAFRDHYAARCEFLRAGCQNPGKSLARLNRAEGKWLDANLERLFPTLMQVHGYHNKQADEEVTSLPFSLRKGRVVQFDVYYRLISGGPFDTLRDIHPNDYAGYFTADLRRGFIDAIHWHGNMPYWAKLMPALAKDDPFVCCRFPTLPANLFERHQDGTWARRVYPDEVSMSVMHLLRPSVMLKRPDGVPIRASYMHRDKHKAYEMAYYDIPRAAREWAEGAPVPISMTDAEFYGDTQSLADAMSV